MYALIALMLESRLTSTLITRFMLDLAEHNIGMIEDPGSSFGSLVISDTTRLVFHAQ